MLASLKTFVPKPVAKFIVPDRGDKNDFGIGLSYCLPAYEYIHCKKGSGFSHPQSVCH
jgi:hypothetical protein